MNGQAQSARRKATAISILLIFGFFRWYGTQACKSDLHLASYFLRNYTIAARTVGFFIPASFGRVLVEKPLESERLASRLRVGAQEARRPFDAKRIAAATSANVRHSR